jgi:hypothetical protein
MADGWTELKNGCYGCTFIGLVVCAFVTGVDCLNDQRILRAPKIVGWILVFSPVEIFLLGYIANIVYRTMKGEDE